MCHSPVDSPVDSPVAAVAAAAVRIPLFSPVVIVGGGCVSHPL